MAKDIAIHWFRQDLRLCDNPGLSSSASKYQILPIYIVDETCHNQFALGRASQWFLHESLAALAKSLKGNLSLYKGDPLKIISRLVKDFNVKRVTWNRCYEPWITQRDTKIKAYLKERDILVDTFNGSLLWEPWEITKADQTPYKVFTHFYRKGCLKGPMPRDPLSTPKRVAYLLDENTSLELDNLNLLPVTNWIDKLKKHWQFGERQAKKKLDNFLVKKINDYKEGRNFPAKNNISKLSPYLNFGVLSPNQVWHKVRQLPLDDNIDHFCSELGWREFAHNLLYNNPKLVTENLQKKFDHFPWMENKLFLLAWQKGKTGIPMVDAGMRELWDTGFMHNRVRMIVGSFLVKNLRLHWNFGERWFRDCLVDADLANNSAGWQWIAGCGADAAPFFRIFNPVTQGQKFDPNGEYVRHHIPELKNLPDKYLFNPWEAPKDVLKEASIILGQTYPYPIVDLKQSREDALSAFKSIGK